MDEYKIIVTPHALTAMQEIRNYIAYNLLNPSAALNLMSAFKESMSKLDWMPERIALTPEQPWHDLDIHRYQIKNYYVYFWVNKDNMAVYITDVIYAGRDQVSQLTKMPME